MSNESTVGRLYPLVPAILRRRDEQEGYPLQRLIDVIEREVVHVEHDIARLYRQWFIETCDDWAVPYMADLIDYPVTGVEEAAGSRSRLHAPRREVAKALSLRRRAGTAALLEELAWDLAGWSARAV